MELQGLFWKVDPPKSTEKRVPPAPVWLAPDYLPGLEEARAFRVPMMQGFADLVDAQARCEHLICDIEEFQNYFLAAFTSVETGKCFYFEFQDRISEEDRAWLQWTLDHFTIITFNGNKFDLPLLALALDGRSCAEIYHAAAMLIYQEVKHWDMLKSFKVDQLEIDHIDLIEVCPLSASLKTYGGRLGIPRLQDLPFKYDSILSPDQIAIIRYYCINDLTATAFVHEFLSEQLQVRREMSDKYDVDLRSKSDAQVAEAVIKAELHRLTGFHARRPEVPPGTTFMYHVPPFVSFRTKVLQDALNVVRNVRFNVNEAGEPELPPEFEDFLIPLGKCTYKIGVGGLHSTEKTICHKAADGFKLVDRDVASYYPSIILNQRLYPLHLGFDFLTVYQSLVTRRLRAKDTPENRLAGTVNKVEADMLKIVINGSFGKFGSKWSALYAPDLLLQVTITGQLCLLMLIEAFELAGVEVCSANTDGVIMKYPLVMEDTVKRVVWEWEQTTRFATEETEFAAIWSRDVNNYVAMKKERGKASAKYLDQRLGFKTKGAFCERGSAGDSVLSKNPENLISIDAALLFLRDGVPITNTVRACRDIRRFVSVRNVKGGAVKDGVFLGKVVRFYYSTTTGGEIVYANSGNMVPKSSGARPCMDLPAVFPDDVDFVRYEKEAFDILADIAAI